MAEQGCRARRLGGQDPHARAGGGSRRASATGTAGIAHEIKNPLNFVNNFAGLSVELLDELKESAAWQAADVNPLLPGDARLTIGDGEVYRPGPPPWYLEASAQSNRLSGIHREQRFVRESH
jgi:signal transduction histidine kinase